MRVRFTPMILAMTLAVAIAAVASGHDNEAPKGDEAKIKAVIDHGFAAWNEHDMVKWASSFTDDADFINVRGTWRKGRKQIEEAHVEAHKRFFGKSRVTLVDHKIKLLGPDTAVAIVTAEMKGHDLPKGTYQTDYNRYTAVYFKVKDDWKITSIENVNLAEPPNKK